MEEDPVSELFEQFDLKDGEQSETDETSRLTCSECLRPTRTCWCSWLNPVQISPRSTVVILQHRNEAKRQIRTAQMLVKGISGDQCKVFVKTKVTSLEDGPSLSQDEKEFREILRRKNVFVLFPTKTSKNAADILATIRSSSNETPSYVLVVIDGTWREAKKMYLRSPALQSLATIHLDLLNLDYKSEYVVRTQPTDQCLSTVETVAHALAILEQDTSIVVKLLAPLRALCSIQIRHGAVVHDSKEFKNDIQTFCKENQRRKLKKSNDIQGDVKCSVKKTDL